MCDLRDDRAVRQLEDSQHLEQPEEFEEGEQGVVGAAAEGGEDQLQRQRGREVDDEPRRHVRARDLDVRHDEEIGIRERCREEADDDVKEEEKVEADEHLWGKVWKGGG